VAVEGYHLLGETLREVYRATGSFLEVGVAYVRFAVGHRAYFEVMYRPELYDPTDEDLLHARSAAALVLYGTGTPDLEQVSDGVAAWALVHGIATLWINGNLPRQLGDDPERIARMVAPHLRTSRA
jgi:deoxyribodipyrimidine photolyase-like uncharacterized protein